MGSARAALHGLSLVALAVVAHGLLGMARTLCPDVPRAVLAMLAASIVLLISNPWSQLLVVVLGGVIGLGLRSGETAATGPHLRPRYGVRSSTALLVLFLLLLVSLPAFADQIGGWLPVIDAFYRAGALVFGGGHVVLPLLEEAVVRPGWIGADDFLAGYGAAQAVPGPMFTLAAYLGARLPGDLGGVMGAGFALAAIFLPGFLLVSGALPVWHALAARPSARRMLAGVNAAVVGLLAAALYDPIWTHAVRGPLDVLIALVGFVLLARWRVSALVVVAWCVAASVGLSRLA